MGLIADEGVKYFLTRSGPGEQPGHEQTQSQGEGQPEPGPKCTAEVRHRDYWDSNLYV